MEDKTNEALLEEVAICRQRIKVLEQKREDNYAFWSTWKFYAQNEAWFEEFIYDHDLRIPWSELRYSYRGDIYEGFVTLEHGIKIWSERKNILQDVEDEKTYFDSVLQELRSRRVTLKEIAPFYGSTVYAVHNYCKLRGVTYPGNNV